MKKTIVVLLFVFLLTGCGKSVSDSENDVTQQTDGTVQASEQVQAEENASEEPEEEGEIVTDDVLVQSMAEEILNNMSIGEKIGQMFIVNLEALDTSQGSYYEHREFTDAMLESLEEYHVGGVILYSRNIETREQTTTLISSLQENTKIPLWISVDEEGGDVARIANNSNMKTTKFPSAWEIGETEDADYAYDMGATIGSDISELGFNLNFAPVSDVKTNETNTEIGNRAFGDDEDLVASMVSAMVKGLQSNGVSATLKHFPGDGEVEGDTHDSSVNIESDLNRLRSVDFVPFQEGIDAGADFVMISHISISRVAGDTTPASLSDLVMKTILRDELGFEGITITDAMDMKAITNDYTSAEAAVKAIQAGADIVLEPENFEEAYNGVYDAYIDQELTEDEIDKSVLRILKKKITRGLILSNTDLISEETE